MSSSRSATLASRVAFGLTVIGLAISAYLTYEHFTNSTTLACSGNGAINCLKVTTSQWSVISGVPVAVAGLAYYIGMAFLCAPFAYARNLGVLRIIAAVIGMAMVLWLVYVELFKVDAICLWCTGVHVTTLAVLGGVLWWREADRSATI